MTEQQNRLQAKVEKAAKSLKTAKAALLKSKRVNIKTLKVESATARELKSGKPAWFGRAIDPKTGTIYQVSAVAVPVKEN